MGRLTFHYFEGKPLPTIIAFHDTMPFCADCWCEPVTRKPCPACASVSEVGQITFSPVCETCRGKGLVQIDLREQPPITFIVHDTAAKRTGRPAGVLFPV